MDLIITTKNMKKEKLYTESSQVYNFDETDEMLDFLKLCFLYGATDCKYEII